MPKRGSQALKEFLLLPDAGVLTAINKRIAQHLEQSPAGQTGACEPQLSRPKGPKRGCIGRRRRSRDPVGAAVAARRYAETLRA